MFYNANISNTVGENLIPIVLINARRLAIPGLAMVGLIFLLLQKSAPLPLLLAWSIITTFLMIVRVLVLRVLISRKNMSLTSKLDVISILSIVNGSAFASLLFFFPALNGFERAMLTAVLTSSCMSATLADSGYRPFCLNFAFPILTALIVLWIYNPGQVVEPYIGYIVALMLTVCAVCLSTLGQPTFRGFAVSVESKEKQEVLTKELTTALALAEHAKLQAELSSESKTRFLASASHDLRQPVHVLSLYGAVLQSAELDPRLRDIVDDVNIAVESLSTQLDTLLDLSRLDSGAVKPNKRAVDMQLLMEKIENEFSKVAANKNVQFINKVNESSFAWTDMNMISQVLRNLCGNAIKYTRFGRVTVSISTNDDSSLSVCVSDTGIGIPEEDLKRIFEEFYQVANPGRDKSMGLGLGLSIVERIVRSLGHKIDVESTFGKGTAFTVVLDKCEPHEIHEIKPSRHNNQKVLSLLDSLWIHVVDDDAAVRKSMTLLLEQIGCFVTVSDSSHATRRFLKENTPSALLVDLRLQGKDSGLKIIDYMNAENLSIPVTLITGESLHVTPLPDEYSDVSTLQKPITQEGLLQVLTQLPRTHQGGETTAGQSDELSRDRVTE